MAVCHSCPRAFESVQRLKKKIKGVWQVIPSFFSCGRILEKVIVKFGMHF